MNTEEINILEDRFSYKFWAFNAILRKNKKTLLESKYEYWESYVRRNQSQIEQLNRQAKKPLAIPLPRHE